ncbi:HAD hydrolase-like protein [Breoghania sp.]|uniref:HAD family hydrolase n=1 Tax=Breoghania sp. TaxID=2065378 RepID=UPI002616BC44|nr:HAD hydrolase-like protein [Breoghania sp.]MDJ0933603.1 HAD hydrolase-like protein [Breoghania sp.]
MDAKPAALIFDWDNAMIDGTAYFAAVDAAVFERIRREDGVEASSPHEALPGESDLAFFTRLPGREDLARKAMALFEACTRGVEMPVDLLSGAAELLRFAEDHGIPHAVHSNSEDAYLRDFVRVVCTHADLHVPLTVGIQSGRVGKKPDPGGIHEVLRLLSLSDAPIDADRRVWIVGDSAKTDGQAGCNAGTSVALVP